MLHYLLRHDHTDATTGYFACVPEGFGTDGNDHLPDLLRLLSDTPNDTFLHDFILKGLMALPERHRQHLLEASDADPDIVRAVTLEARLLCDEEVHPDECVRLWEKTGFGLLLWSSDHGRAERIASVRRLRESITFHTDHPFSTTVHTPNLSPIARSLPRFELQSPPSAEETSREALERLLEARIIESPEYRHTSSLAPVGLMRYWSLGMHVEDGNMHYTVHGELTSWGRGMSVADARVSCVMEIVERASAYLSVINGEVTDRKVSLPIRKAPFSELTQKGLPALDPNHLVLGVPYRNQSISWIEARTSTTEKKLVPLQAAGLFCNLDEPSLLLPQISTGLATGTTFQEAALSGVLEVIERDADARTPFRESDCFLLTTENRSLRALLHAYAQCGIYPVFRKLSVQSGIPCYEAFVIPTEGTCLRATAAKLSARQAILSALTEVPCPFPSASRTISPPTNLPSVVWEDLPDYGTGSAKGDLLLAEAALAQCGRHPLYVDLTRRDLDFPVIRTIIPGMEPTSDFDVWARLPDNLQ